MFSSATFGVEGLTTTVNELHFVDNLSFSAAPEPASMLLLACAVGLLYRRRR